MKDTDKLNEFIDHKWMQYQHGLAIAVSLRKDKQYSYEDVKSAFSSGAYELLQVLYHNNIDIGNLDFDVE